jgi:TonB family protein
MPENQVTSFIKVLTPSSAYDTAPKFLRGNAPYYPPRSPAERVWGYAAIDFNVEPDGSTSDIRLFVAKGFDFAQEAAVAVNKWRFAPAQKNGQPVRVRVRLPFTFRI